MVPARVTPSNSRWGGTLHLPEGKHRVIDTQKTGAGNRRNIRRTAGQRHPVRGDVGAGSSKAVGSDPAGDISVRGFAEFMNKLEGQGEFWLEVKA